MVGRVERKRVLAECADGTICWGWKMDQQLETAALQVIRSAHLPLVHAVATDKIIDYCHSEGAV